MLIVWIFIIGLLNSSLIVSSGYVSLLLVQESSPKESIVSAYADHFDANRAYSYCETQVGFGSRIPGTAEHSACLTWMENYLQQIGSPQRHSFIYDDINCSNLLIRINPGKANIVAFGAHWDSRAKADSDPNSSLRDQPVPGANDGASGVAVLFEMLNVLSTHVINWDVEFWFFFFDAEDQGELTINSEKWEWIVGSNKIVQALISEPTLFFQTNQTIQNITNFILLDMVGGTNLQFIYEGNSNSNLRKAVFDVGMSMGYTNVFPSSGATNSITDDHLPFKNHGIPTLDLIIKFWDRSSSSNWPYHHTTGDNLEHLDVESLNITGRTLLQYLYNNYRTDRPTNQNTSYSFPSNTSLFGLEDYELAILGASMILVLGLICIIGRSGGAGKKNMEGGSDVKENMESKGEVKKNLEGNGDVKKNFKDIDKITEEDLSDVDQRILEEFKNDIKKKGY